MSDSTFSPFYERPAKIFPGILVGGFIVSLVLGLLVLAVLYAVMGDNIFTDWTVFLPALISTAMFSLYVATYTLCSLFPQMDARLQPKSSEVYMEPLNRYLSDRNFLLAGFFFGSINVLLGLLFGIPYSGPSPSPLVFNFLSFIFAYFVAGFVCGMAAYGIIAVSISIDKFSQEAKHYIDYTSPDRCGGTRFIGDALVVFAAVTLVVGVMISVYILKADWTESDNWWIDSLKWFWIIFPYIMSLMVLLAPSSGVHSALTKYRLDQDAVLIQRISCIREQLNSSDIQPESIKELRESYEYQKREREALYKMRTWPFDIDANIKYISVLTGNVIASTSGVMEWLSGN